MWEKHSSCPIYTLNDGFEIICTVTPREKQAKPVQFVFILMKQSFWDSKVKKRISKLIHSFSLIKPLSAGLTIRGIQLSLERSEGTLFRLILT
jgi:hypothetical protein